MKCWPITSAAHDVYYSSLEFIEDALHGFNTTRAKRFNRALLDFLG